MRLARGNYKDIEIQMEALLKRRGATIEKDTRRDTGRRDIPVRTVVIKHDQYRYRFFLDSRFNKGTLKRQNCNGHSTKIPIPKRITIS